MAGDEDNGNQNKKTDAQVENEFNKIKDLIRLSNNFTELKMLAGLLANLALSTNNPKLEEQIKAAQTSTLNKAENAEQNVSSKKISENVEAQHQREEAKQVEELNPVKHSYITAPERAAREEQTVNISKYNEIKPEFHKKLDEDISLLDAALDPTKATPEQIRILNGELTEEEKEAREKQRQLKRDGFANVYKIKENAEEAIKLNNQKIAEINKKLETTIDSEKRQPLLDEREERLEDNKVRQQQIDLHVKNEEGKRDTEREKLTKLASLKERAGINPKYIQDEIEDHFKLHVKDYEKELEKDPNHPALNQLHEMVRQVGLAKKLGVDPGVPKLDEHLELMNAAIDPSKATPEQTRILENKLTPEEKEIEGKKDQQKKDDSANVYKTKKAAEKEIKHNNKKIVEIDKQLEDIKDPEQRKKLLDEKEKYIEINKTRQNELDGHVKAELDKRDQERAKLTELTESKEAIEKYPEFAQKEVRQHFESHAEEYKKVLEKDSNHPALEQLHEMVRKVGLAEELGVDPGVQKIDSRQEVQKIDRQEEIDKLNKEYPKGSIPREETNKVANIMVRNLGYSEQAKIIAEKKQVKEIANEQNNKISAPNRTPSTPITEAKKKGKNRGE